MMEKIKKGLLLSVAFVGIVSVVTGQDNRGKMSGKRNACVSKGAEYTADTTECDKKTGGQSFWALPQKRVGIKMKRTGDVLGDSCQQESVLKIVDEVKEDTVVDVRRNFMEVARKRKNK